MISSQECSQTFTGSLTKTAFCNRASGCFSSKDEQRGPHRETAFLRMLWKVIWSLISLISAIFLGSFTSQNMQFLPLSVTLKKLAQSTGLCLVIIFFFMFLNKKKTWQCCILVPKRCSQASGPVVLEWAYVGILVPVCNLEQRNPRRLL